MEKYLKKKISVNTLECMVCSSHDVLGIPIDKDKIKYIALLCKGCFNLEIALMENYQKEMQSE